MPDGLDELLGSLDSDTPKAGGLRAQLEAVLAERNALKTQIEQLSASQRQRDANDLFAKHAIPELARDLFPKDSELTDEAATAFVGKYGALWGAKAGDAATPAAQAQTVTTVADQAASGLIQQIAGQAGAPTLEPRSEEHYRAQFAEATTKAELEQMFSNLVLDVGL